VRNQPLEIRPDSPLGRLLEERMRDAAEGRLLPLSSSQSDLQLLCHETVITDLDRAAAAFDGGHPIPLENLLQNPQLGTPVKGNEALRCLRIPPPDEFWEAVDTMVFYHVSQDRNAIEVLCVR